MSEKSLVNESSSEISDLTRSSAVTMELHGKSRRADKEYKYAVGEMRTIVLQREKGKAGDRPVPVCVQGNQFTIPRGVPTKVPAMVAEVLRLAEEEIVEWDEEIDALSFRKAQSYAFAEVA